MIRVKGAGQPHWPVADWQRVGFLLANVAEAERQSVVNDIYMLPEERRQGYGSTMVRALCEHLDERSALQIDVDVRRDNPGALAFWEAQGYRVALSPAPVSEPGRGPQPRRRLI